MNKPTKKLCAICGNRYPVGRVKFYTVPKIESRRQRWIDACGLALTDKSLVCEKHFEETDFCHRQHFRSLMPGAVPSVQVREMPELNNLEKLPSNMVHRGIQTLDTADLRYREEIYFLKNEIAELKAEKQKYMEECQKLYDTFSLLFTKVQIKKLMNPAKSCNWTHEDITNAISLHSAGPRAYRLLYDKSYPLPHPSTLFAWARKLKVDAGTRKFPIDCLQSMSEKPAEEKICIISLNEMKAQEPLEQDPLNDSIPEPSKYEQMVIVRGLNANWKQPIHLDFDTKMMTKNTIIEIITALHEASFPVVAIVSSISPTYQGLWKELQVSREKPWFSHPADEAQKIFVFADVPHLLKLLRNHFLNTGLLYDGKLLTVQTVKAVMQYSEIYDFAKVHKLSEKHITPLAARTLTVKMTAQLFSNTTAEAIRWSQELGMDLNFPTETAEFFKLINDWFDIHNSKVCTNNIAGKKPFGLELSNQLKILESIDAIMEKPLLPFKSKLAPFQNGILVSNSALRMLYSYVGERYGLSYIVTNRCTKPSRKNTAMMCSGKELVSSIKIDPIEVNFV